MIPRNNICQICCCCCCKLSSITHFHYFFRVNRALRTFFLWVVCCALVYVREICWKTACTIQRYWNKLQATCAWIVGDEYPSGFRLAVALRFVILKTVTWYWKKKNKTVNLSSPVILYTTHHRIIRMAPLSLSPRIKKKKKEKENVASLFQWVLVTVIRAVNDDALHWNTVVTLTFC